MKYQTLKTGEPLEVYANVIKKVSSKMQTRFVDAPGDHKVSILFCPVISRIGSDAETALATIKGKLHPHLREDCFNPTVSLTCVVSVTKFPLDQT